MSRCSLEPGKPVAIVFVVYNLPNRDCSAKARAGQLAVEKGGEQRYRTEFIDEIAKQFSAYQDQRIIAILEPDSLANLVTNLNVPKCAASNEIYRNAIAYVVTQLALPNVSLYLDAAHAGWMGWQGNPEKLAAVFQDVLARAGGADKIRGAATNVSNYNTVSGQDGRKLGPANPCADERELTFQDDLPEGFHQGAQALLSKIRDRRVPVRALPGRGNACASWQCSLAGKKRRPYKSTICFGESVELRTRVLAFGCTRAGSFQARARSPSAARERGAGGHDGDSAASAARAGEARRSAAR